MPSESQTFTYQTRISISDEADLQLIRMAEILSPIERHLFKDLASGKETSALKAFYIKKYQITARHFNAIRVQLEGKNASANPSSVTTELRLCFSQ